MNQQCVAETMEQLQGEIAGLQELQERLGAYREWREGRTPTAAPATEKQEQGARARSGAHGVTRPTKSPGADARRVNARESGDHRYPAEFVMAVRNLRAPFSQQDIKQATGAPNGTVSSRTHKWTQTGWLRKVGPGQYERGPHFPTGTALTTAPHPVKGSALNDIHRQIRSEVEPQLEARRQAGA